MVSGLYLSVTMKKIIYITCFAVLGLLLATLLHAFIEIVVLEIITSDWERYRDSFIWQNWSFLHLIIAGAFWIKGAGFGLWAGIYFWRVIYEEKRYFRKANLKTSF